MVMFEITKLAPIQIEDQPVIVIPKSYTKRIDFINDNLLYKGEAIVGAAVSASIWKIKRITIENDGDVSEEYADGNDNFDNAWTDRLTKGYN
jgi:hypothetical protein